MPHHPEQVQRADVLRIGGADQATEALGLGQAAGALMLDCGGELVRGSALEVHGTGSRVFGPRPNSRAASGSIAAPAHWYGSRAAIVVKDRGRRIGE
jgi:hypothetical protein